jgi:hypothetical protein
LDLTQSIEILIEITITALIIIFFSAIPIYFAQKKNNKNDKIKT